MQRNLDSALSCLIRLGVRKLFYGQPRGLEAYPECRFHVGPFCPLCPYHKPEEVSLNIPAFLTTLRALLPHTKNTVKFRSSERQLIPLIKSSVVQPIQVIQLVRR